MGKFNIKRDSFWLYAVLLFVVSCNNNQTNNPEKSNAAIKPDTMSRPIDTAKAITIKNGIHCFAYINNNDTVFLSLVINGKTATGKLTYNLYEKDKNSGTLTGKWRGDTLLADYSFYSEGLHSVRQVAFLRKGNVLQEGYGSMKEQRNKLVFSHIQDIDFNGNMILEPVGCDVYKK